jgi:hypothetical protein
MSSAGPEGPTTSEAPPTTTTTGGAPKPSGLKKMSGLIKKHVQLEQAKEGEEGGATGGASS